MNTETIKKGGSIEADVTDVAFGGRGIARLDGMVVFIEGALPGDRVRATITKRKAQYAEATTTEILKSSETRVEAPCPSFGTCGGCKWQNFDYSEQIRAKQRHVEDSLRHIGRHQQPYEMRPIIASPDPWNYRNKMEFSFGWADQPGSRALSKGPITVGFHMAGDFRRIVDVGECHIQPALLNEVLGFVRERINRDARAEGEHFQPYDTVRHTGYLRHLVLRYSATTGHFLMALLTAPGPWKGAGAFADDFLARFPQCNGFIWGTNSGLSDVARAEKIVLERGENTLTETLGDKTFRLSAFSFFQTNTRGATILYDTVKEFSELTGHESVLDAYCGTGTIGIYVSDHAKRVVGIELVKEAVWDARHNAKLNNATNCTFLAGEMRDVLPTVPSTLGGGFDRVIVDPPRGGMDKKSLRYLIEVGAPVFVYVSCNPATLARDAQVLGEAGYQLEVVQPVDLFPHTYHVESVLKFRKQSDRDGGGDSEGIRTRS